MPHREIVDLKRYACDYIFFFFQAEDGIRDLTVTGVQTCALPICRRAPDADGDRRVDDAGAERGGDRDRQQKVREGEQDLDPPHDRRVEPPTGEARDAAERAAGHDRDGGRERPDEERHTRPVDHPREDVAAELVRAEEVLGVRARALLEERLLDGILRREERCRRRDQDEPGDERQAEERQAVSPEPPGRVGAHPCLEMRGSTRPYERSTSRFTRTNANANTSTAPRKSTESREKIH